MNEFVALSKRKREMFSIEIRRAKNNSIFFKRRKEIMMKENQLSDKSKKEIEEYVGTVYDCLKEQIDKEKHDKIEKSFDSLCSALKKMTKAESEYTIELIFVSSVFSLILSSFNEYCYNKRLVTILSQIIEILFSFSDSGFLNEYVDENTVVNLIDLLETQDIEYSENMYSALSKLVYANQPVQLLFDQNNVLYTISKQFFQRYMKGGSEKLLFGYISLIYSFFFSNKDNGEETQGYVEFTEILIHLYLNSNINQSQSTEPFILNFFADIIYNMDKDSFKRFIDETSLKCLLKKLVVNLVSYHDKVAKQSLLLLINMTAIDDSSLFKSLITKELPEFIKNSMITKAVFDVRSIRDLLINLLSFGKDYFDLFMQKPDIYEFIFYKVQEVAVFSDEYNSWFTYFYILFEDTENESLNRLMFRNAFIICNFVSFLDSLKNKEFVLKMGELIEKMIVYGFKVLRDDKEENPYVLMIREDMNAIDCINAMCDHKDREIRNFYNTLINNYFTE